jgi:hypothetical protein
MVPVFQTLIDKKITRHEFYPIIPIGEEIPTTNMEDDGFTDCEVWEYCTNSILLLFVSALTIGGVIGKKKLEVIQRRLFKSNPPILPLTTQDTQNQ